MLVKAVAHHTTASFIRVVGSEFVQKYLGEGPRMVRDVFRLARENAPAIIFIDEVDAIATKRFDAQTGADREVQRILLELLNQMDGFDQGSNVKVIMATNRADTLDPALLRPGRLDRKIEFPLPSRREKRLIFQTITGKMSLSNDVDLEDYVSRPDKLSAAEISSICQAAGLQAVRKNRYVILPADFEEAWKSVVKRNDETHEFCELPCPAKVPDRLLTRNVTLQIVNVATSFAVVAVILLAQSIGPMPVRGLRTYETCRERMLSRHCFLSTCEVMLQQPIYRLPPHKCP